MIKSELVSHLASKALPLSYKNMEFLVNSILDIMKQAIIDGEGIEIRGFGSMHRRYHKARSARNPKTGALVTASEKFSLHFTPGKALKQRVNQAASNKND